MSDIATVIGWKFNHQSGMGTEDGIITKFPGGIPSQSDQDAWTAEYLEATKWDDTRNKRDRLLKDSDFTQLDDSPKDKVAWKTYRQALRDITNAATPDDVVWPTEPGA